MKGFYEKLLDGRIVDRPPCSRCLHRNKMTVEEPCYSCIDLMDLSLHRPNVETELVVKIKADPDYPGISVAFCGNGMNDCFNEGSIRLAWIEYSPEKRRLQAIVYGDGDADDYTQLIEFKNILDQDK